MCDRHRTLRSSLYKKLNRKENKLTNKELTESQRKIHTDKQTDAGDQKLTPRCRQGLDVV